ncbi:MAG TPA: 3-phosphoshikimate 1-carboxyvinyltransferase [Vitreimonas sp.]|nr:3-phosphoshikimate 1-carboxyvinyltransferase [Vitreimonas sp.]HYD86430.1 3-phosphoshikimate 1-carboxyvinyltransferase [Vitreimonas sp.]
MRLKARFAGPLRGRARPPGDKSISHRALILGALAHGVTEIDGLLEAEDVLCTAQAVRQFGAQADKRDDGRWRVTGAGGFSQPSDTIDCGNSGTAARLLMGAASGFKLSARLDGDQSLRKRPMNRVVAPLSQMGARFDSTENRLPLIVHGGKLKGVTYRSPVSSAQVKSAVLLAGLRAEGETVLIEPERSRDHTERMLGVFGADIDSIEVDGGQHPRVRPSQLRGANIYVPADPSSAAFPIAAALILGKSEIRVEDVLVNPLRLGFYETLLEMGAKLTYEERRDPIGEPIADIVAQSSKLHGASPPAKRAPAMIDEFPILSVVAAFAQGETRIVGASELRVKESDRITLMVDGLKACGVDAEELPDGLIVRGNGPKSVRGGAQIRTLGDHRVAMSFLVLGMASKEPVTVDDAEMIATSFPDFIGCMQKLGADIREV